MLLSTGPDLSTSLAVRERCNLSYLLCSFTMYFGSVWPPHSVISHQACADKEDRIELCLLFDRQWSSFACSVYVWLGVAELCFPAVEIGAFCPAYALSKGSSLPSLPNELR